MIKNELQYIFSGQGEVKFGAIIQAIIGYLAGSEKSGKTSQQDKHFRKEETKRLISWIEKEIFGIQTLISILSFQKVQNSVFSE